MNAERHINNVVVAKNCARTSETNNLDGVPFTGVQIWMPTLNSSGTAAASSYFGEGEVVITSPSGAVQTSAITKAIEEIAIHYRKPGNASPRRTKLLAGKDIVDYRFKAYEAASEQVTGITGITAADSTTYLLKIIVKGYGCNHIAGLPLQKTFAYTSGTSATVEEILTGLATKINEATAADEALFDLTASVVNSDQLLIEANTREWELGRFPYHQLRFDVETVNFTATVADNSAANFVDTAGTTHNKATLGSGTYKQVAEMEYFAAQHEGFQPLFEAHLPSRAIALNANSDNTYDTIVIRWQRNQGRFSADTEQHGVITLFLPVEDNASNQQADLIATLNKYIVTEFGVGSAITLS